MVTKLKKENVVNAYIIISHRLVRKAILLYVTIGMKLENIVLNRYAHNRRVNTK